MVLRAPGLASGAQASSRSRKTWSAGSVRALSRNFWLDPGTARQDRRERVGRSGELVDAVTGDSSSFSARLADDAGTPAGDSAPPGDWFLTQPGGRPVRVPTEGRSARRAPPRPPCRRP